MAEALNVVKRMHEFLTELGSRGSLSQRATHSLNKDLGYLQRAADILSARDTDAVNDLWREVQYISRFFGEGYAEGSDQQKLLKLMDEFETALLDDIVVLRSLSQS
jgi:hypothetical protein